MLFLRKQNFPDYRYFVWVPPPVVQLSALP